MRTRLFSTLVVSVIMLSLFAPSYRHLTLAESVATPPNLSFQADIYGDFQTETVEYLSDLTFHSWGDSDSTARIYRARLSSSGDEIAYAISASTPNAFSFDVIPETGERLTIAVASADYPRGTVVALPSGELQFTWDINQSGLHIRLHRYASLVHDNRVTNVIQERYVVENLGPEFFLMSFSEHLHIDDRARTRDYDNSGRDETLLAINSSSTDGYPVFGKVYLRQEVVDVEVACDGIFATVTHGLYTSIRSSSTKDMTLAAFVSSTTRNDIAADVQVAKDAAALLGLDHVSNQWSVRTHNSDDAGGVFVNGLMVAGSRYSSCTDSGWPSINRYLRQREDNYVSFASYDMGICCGSRWGFGLERNNVVLWSTKGSGPIGEGIAYQHILKISPLDEVTDYQQEAPSPTIDGNWYVLVRAHGGIGFVLVDKLPVSGSVHDQAQWVEITSLLGQFENHVHFNAWNDGVGRFDWYSAIKRGDQIVWEDQMQIPDGPCMRVRHIELVIDAKGNVYPTLDLPVDYTDRRRGSITAFRDAFNLRTTSLFDHDLPDDSSNYKMLPYDGEEGPNPGGAEDCNLPYCYDGHNGYDIDDRCPAPASCYSKSAVYPAADGEIVPEETGYDADLGCQITIDHGNQWRTVYAHLLDPEEDGNCEGILRDEGPITRLDQIGIIGCSGSGCKDAHDHLHFEVKHYVNGDYRVVDPAGWDSVDDADLWAGKPLGARSFRQWLDRYQTQLSISMSTGGQFSTPDSAIRVTIPAGYYNTALTFNLSGVPAADLAGRLANSGISFSLTAHDAAGNSISQLDKNFEIRIEFSSGNIENLKRHTISIFMWDETTSRWVALPTSIDFDNLVAVTQVNRISVFALMGEPLEKTYLPLVVRAQ